LRPPLLEIAGVNKTFGKSRVLSDISFSVGEAEVVGFVGPNGAGKTTTMKIMCGLLRADSGTVSLAGFDLRRQPQDFLARVGVLIESPGMFPSLSAGDHLAYLGRVRGCHEPATIARTLAAVGLAADSRKPARQFSLGMKQRLGIAMAILHQPQLLILDEPMNGLDPSGMVKLRELVRSLCRDSGISVFISSHLLHEVEQVCDRVLFIREGRLLKHAEVSAGRLAEIAAVYVRTGDDAAACALLRAQSFIQEVNPLDRGIECRLPAECVPRLAELLVAARIPLCELGPRRTSLEQVYLTYYPEGGSQPIQ